MKTKKKIMLACILLVILIFVSHIFLYIKSKKTVNHLNSHVKDLKEDNHTLNAKYAQALHKFNKLKEYTDKTALNMIKSAEYIDRDEDNDSSLPHENNYTSTPKPHHSLLGMLEGDSTTTPSPDMLSTPFPSETLTSPNPDNNLVSDSSYSNVLTPTPYVSISPEEVSTPVPTTIDFPMSTLYPPSTTVSPMSTIYPPSTTVSPMSTIYPPSTTVSPMSTVYPPMSTAIPTNQCNYPSHNKYIDPPVPK